MSKRSLERTIACEVSVDVTNGVLLDWLKNRLHKALVVRSDYDFAYSFDKVGHESSTLVDLRSFLLFFRCEHSVLEAFDKLGVLTMRGDYFE
jgi:hypothetical protein